MQTYRHTDIQTYIRTDIQAFTHSHIHKHTHMCTYVNIYFDTHIHTFYCPYAYALAFAYFALLHTSIRPFKYNSAETLVARYVHSDELIVAVDFEGVELNRHGPLCLVQMHLG